MKERIEAPRSQFMQTGETPSLNLEYCLTGEAYHGDVKYVDEGIIGVGEDTLMFLPEHGLFGVFDGAGVASDVGRADIASQTAAKAVAEYFINNLDIEKSKQFMQEALTHARKVVSVTEGAGITTGLFVHLSESTNKNLRVLFGSAGDCAAALYPDPVFDDRRYEDALWFAGEQDDTRGTPTNFIGTENSRVKRGTSDQAGELKLISRDKKRWLIIATDGITGSIGLSNGIDEADIEYAFTYKHNIKSIADSLINPPLQRDEYQRKVDDKTLIVIGIN